ncbi:MAG: FecR domain-containing protein [Mariniphaga sp.]|nr:FecR domain-containing protein [Mariniphaga sp.]
MNDKFLHSNKLESENSGFFAGGKFAWEKSKENIWDENFSDIDSPAKGKSISLLRKISYGIAASFILLIGLSSVAWFLSERVATNAGEHFTAQLPDGSVVEMNAESTLKFYPYRWYVSRNLEFEGEGFFNVEKGKKFVVKSALGKTSVLGTSFNVFSRDDIYKVACVTGKVRVIASNKESVILNPNQQVVLKLGDELIKNEVLKPEEVLLWRNNMFLFNATPLSDVAREIERQYGVTIQIDENIKRDFTGIFNRQSNVEEVLEYICKPLNYNFIKQNENNYLIVRKN